MQNDYGHEYTYLYCLECEETDLTYLLQLIRNLYILYYDDAEEEDEFSEAAKYSCCNTADYITTVINDYSKEVKEFRLDYVAVMSEDDEDGKHIKDKDGDCWWLCDEKYDIKNIVKDIINKEDYIMV